MPPPNDQQQAVLDWATSTTPSPHLNLVARAGTGKTFTLVLLANHIDGTVLATSFSRAIADTLIERLPKRAGMHANTVHGIGLKAWKSQYRRGVDIDIDGYKVSNIFRENYHKDKKTVEAAASLISYAKQTGLGVWCPYEDIDEWEKIIDHYDLEDDIPSHMRRRLFLEACMSTYETSLEACYGKGTDGNKIIVDFDDMLLAPLYYKLELPQVDWCLLDEAQDTSELRRRIAFGIIKDGGRLVAVGDEKQAVFGFAGADNNAMEIIQKQLSSHILPLNITYRCPKLIVEMAKQWAPDYTAHPSAPDGVIRTITHDNFWGEDFQPGHDVILCRVTRPLVGIAVNLRKRNIPCVVEGQSAKTYLRLVYMWGANITITRFLTLLEGYKRDKEAEWVDKPEKLARLRDRVGSVQTMAASVNRSSLTRELGKMIEYMFKDTNTNTEGKLVLSTIHRAKGREWPRVNLVGRNRYQPGWWVRQDWELEQEKNLEYVAVTRTMEELVEVEVPEAEDENGNKTVGDWWELD